MMGVFIVFVTIYLFGGLTFLPGVLLLVLLHAYFTLPACTQPSNLYKTSTDPLRDPQDDGRNIKSTSSTTDLAEKFHRRHERDVAAGYFAVCREYVPGGVNGKPPERTTPAGAVVAAESPSVYQSMYRSIFDRRQGPSLDPGKGNGKVVKRARNVFFVVLRHGHLMLYEDSEQMEVKHVISLELHDVGICGVEETIPEGELWIKRNAIELRRKSGIESPASSSKPFFFFSENCSEKEDFYFALLQNQDTMPDALDNPPRPQQYETDHIIGLVQKLYSSEEHLQTRWINGLIGRLFLALYKTRATEDFIRKKITKKIARVKKPAFLSGIVLQKIDMGDGAPYITNPRLKDLTIDGDCCAEADFKYSGNFRLEVAATARIDLGARFKAREVNLVLAVVVKKLHGHALIKFKPPPSNRVWISFDSMPDLEISIESMVSSRQITYGIILRAIESRIREVIAETMVLPHWDDSPFTDTCHQKFRGGIWAGESFKAPSQSEPIKIPDEAPEDEVAADFEADGASVAHASLQTKDERSLSMPVLSDASPLTPVSQMSAASSTQESIRTAKSEASTESQKRNEPPKALRSRSFASAANPLLSMDNANFEFSQVEQNRKQQQDAASAIKAISSRSRPTSPSDTSDESIAKVPLLWENGRHSGSGSTLLFNLHDSGEKTPRAVSTDSHGQAKLTSIPIVRNSRSTELGLKNDTPQPQALQGDTRNTNGPGKRQSMATLGAATVAAKNWGWSVLNRNANQKNVQGLKQDGAGTPGQPLGRGRPLPPPGQPLPFPQGTRSKTSIATTSKRKPVAPPTVPQRGQDERKAHADAPPPLPIRKTQKSNSPSCAGDEQLLVVEAPPDSEPSSPADEQLVESPSSFSAGNLKNSTVSLIRDFDGVGANGEFSAPEGTVTSQPEDPHKQNGNALPSEDAMEQ